MVWVNVKLAMLFIGYLTAEFGSTNICVLGLGLGLGLR